MLTLIITIMIIIQVQHSQSSDCTIASQQLCLKISPTNIKSLSDEMTSESNTYHILHCFVEFVVKLVVHTDIGKSAMQLQTLIGNHVAPFFMTLSDI